MHQALRISASVCLNRAPGLKRDSSAIIEAHGVHDAKLSMNKLTSWIRRCHHDHDYPNWPRGKAFLAKLVSNQIGPRKPEPVLFQRTPINIRHHAHRVACVKERGRTADTISFNHAAWRAQLSSRRLIRIGTFTNSKFPIKPQCFCSIGSGHEVPKLRTILEVLLDALSPLERWSQAILRNLPSQRRVATTVRGMVSSTSQ